METAMNTATTITLRDDPERICLSNLAKEALADNGGDVKLAISALNRRLTEEKHLLKEIIADAIFEAAESVVRKQNIETRRALFRGPSRVAKDSRETVISLARAITASLLDFPLPDGSLLRDATPEKVGMMIDRYERASRDMGHKARWLKHIIQGVQPGQRVGDVVTDERAKELWEATIDA